MLNRFRNAIYGSSGSSEDSTMVMDEDYRETMLGKKVRTALTRSSSLREDLMNGGIRGRQNILLRAGDSNRNISASNRSNDDTYDTSQYSQHSSKSHIRGTYNDKSYHTNAGVKQLKYPYQRPEFLQLRTDDEILVSADHQIRPIILPRDVSRLPWRSGYAECINAGKSLRNEDQATCYQGVAFEQSDTDDDDFHDQLPLPIYKSIPWTYFAVFDGHAGSAVAIAAAKQLHHILAAKLNSVAKRLIKVEFGEEDSKIRSLLLEAELSSKNSTGEASSPPCDATNDEARETLDDPRAQDSSGEDADASNNVSKCDKIELEREKKVEITSPQSSPIRKDLRRARGMRVFSSLALYGPEESYVGVRECINGALESAFWEMDALIGRDKRDYKMPGGCTAIVGLFILGKLYVCNAGDSRAIVCKNREAVRMSYDFTPISDQQRIARLALQCPRLLGDTFTQVEYFPRHPCKSQIGSKMLYKDAYMSGIAVKTITQDDLKYPLVCGEGKRSRLLATIGVTRGFGDHEMRSQYGSVPIKPFLTPEPQIKVLDIEDDDRITADDVLIIGTDGLWDVTSDEMAEQIISSSFNIFPDNEESRSKYRYMTAAQDLIINSRGLSNGYSVWMNRDEESYASHDDIAAFVIPLKPYKLEYQEWKRTRFEALAKALNSNQNFDPEENSD